MFSSIAAATKPVVQRAGLLFYSPIAVSPVVVDKCDFCFRQNAPIDKMSGATFGLIEKQFGKPGSNKLFLVLESTDYGRMEGKMGEERFARPDSPIKVVGTTSIAQGAANAQNAVSRVIAESPDVVYLSVATTQTQLLLVQQLRNNGYKGNIVASSATLAILLDAAKTSSQEKIVDGVVGIDTWSPDLTNAENKAFLAAYRTATGKIPLKYNEAGYMSVMIVAGAMDKAGSTETMKVAQAISANTWSTPEGPARFEDRSMVHHYYTQKISNGQIVSLAD
jgi:branched-chain amino acid transport system substrate-binding protein